MPNQAVTSRQSREALPVATVLVVSSTLELRFQKMTVFRMSLVRVH